MLVVMPRGYLKSCNENDLTKTFLSIENVLVWSYKSQNYSSMVITNYAVTAERTTNQQINRIVESETSDIF